MQRRSSDYGSTRQGATARYRARARGGAGADGPRRANGGGPPSRVADEPDRGGGRPLPGGVAASPVPGRALPRPVGDARRGRRARLVPVRRRPHAHRLWRPSSDEGAAPPGQGRTAVRVPLGGQGSHVGPAARAAGDLRQEPGAGPDQLGASRRALGGGAASRRRRRPSRRAADRPPARRPAPANATSLSGGSVGRSSI